MNSVADSHPDFNREVLVKLDNGLFAVAKFNHIDMGGFSKDYWTVGKAIAANDPHFTGRVVEWMYI
jgi:hypothetical protein